MYFLKFSNNCFTALHHLDTKVFDCLNTKIIKLTNKFEKLVLLFILSHITLWLDIKQFFNIENGKERQERKKDQQ